MSSKRAKKVAAVVMALVFGGVHGDCAIMPQKYDGKTIISQASENSVAGMKTKKYTSFKREIPFHKQG